MAKMLRMNDGTVPYTEFTTQCCQYVNHQNTCPILISISKLLIYTLDSERSVLLLKKQNLNN